jgi:hypothetical protein
MGTRFELTLKSSAFSALALLCLVTAKVEAASKLQTAPGITSASPSASGANNTNQLNNSQADHGNRRQMQRDQHERALAEKQINKARQEQYQVLQRTMKEFEELNALLKNKLVEWKDLPDKLVEKELKKLGNDEQKQTYQEFLSSLGAELLASTGQDGNQNLKQLPHPINEAQAKAAMEHLQNSAGQLTKAKSIIDKVKAEISQPIEGADPGLAFDKSIRSALLKTEGPTDENAPTPDVLSGVVRKFKVSLPPARTPAETKPKPADSNPTPHGSSSDEESTTDTLLPSSAAQTTEAPGSSKP